MGEETTPRESGAAMTSESNLASDLSNAASPMGSGASQASTAAVAAFFAPRRWKLLKNHRQIDGRGRRDLEKRLAIIAERDDERCLPRVRLSRWSEGPEFPRIRVAAVAGDEERRFGEAADHRL